MTEPCTQQTSIALVEQSTQKIERNVEKILKIIEGNGNNGLITRVALNRQSLTRIWWWIGGISLSIVGIAFFVIRSAL